MGKLNTLSIKLIGRIPSKKNSKIIVCKGSYPILLPSKNYSLWHEEQSWELKKYKILIKKPIAKCELVEIKFYAPDKRSTDLSNKTESIMDLLVDNEIIKDDNWFVCKSLFVSLVGIDKNNPRAEIKIHY
jgi:hypothetical protein